MLYLSLFLLETNAKIAKSCTILTFFIQLSPKTSHMMRITCYVIKIKTITNADLSGSVDISIYKISYNCVIPLSNFNFLGSYIL